ncbi:[FeFe] hydrogenase H-cluster maturation GTPase HydF [Candidatus Nomurabacteria bacterium]|nr:[FeFe] hydrogenase H-cluster maturation GTPase HydF [Candidatus Nomurabacteria bacterium]
MVLIVESGVWTAFEEDVLLQAKKRRSSIVVVVNKIDQQYPQGSFLAQIKERTEHVLLCSSVDAHKRNEYINIFKESLMRLCPEEFLSPKPILADIIPEKGLVVLIVPIDYEAPKGRIILPQVQCIRDALDHNSACVVVKESEYKFFLNNLKKKPDLVVCDSQVVDQMVADTPLDILCTTFSILFARYKGDLLEEVKGAAVLNTLKPGDKVLIAEACSHHAIEGDIGRVKIPRWLKEYVKGDLVIDSCAGRSYPDNLKEYKVVIHCGACMITRREMLWRIYQANQAGVSITNYGVCISLLQGVLERVLQPFGDILNVYQEMRKQ